MAECKKCKYGRITEFPKKWVDLLIKIETKREMIVQLMGFQEMHRLKRIEDPNHFALIDWTNDISRIASEFGGMLSLLPEDVRHQYNLFMRVQELNEAARKHMVDQNPEKANRCWSEARSLMCCGKEECNG